MEHYGQKGVFFFLVTCVEDQDTVKPDLMVKLTDLSELLKWDNGWITGALT